MHYLLDISLKLATYLLIAFSSVAMSPLAENIIISSYSLVTYQIMAKGVNPW